MAVLGVIAFIIAIIWEQIDKKYLYPKRQEEYDKRMKKLGLK
jgi:hypothetical protein